MQAGGQILILNKMPPSRKCFYNTYARQTIDGRHHFAGDQHEHVAGGDSAAHQGCSDLQWDGARNLSYPSGRK